MAAIYKCFSKTRPREKCPRAIKQETKVTLIPQSCVTFSLPISVVQEIVIALSAELKWLCQKLCKSAEAKIVAKTTASKHFVKRKVRKQSQAAHKCNVKSTIVHCNCVDAERDEEPSRVFKGHKQFSQITALNTAASPAEAVIRVAEKTSPAATPESPGDAFNWNVNNLPAKTQQAGTSFVTNVGAEMSTQNRLGLFYPATRIVTVNNCAVQTLPITENRSCNTKLKATQTRLPLGQQNFQPNEKIQRKERRPAAELKQHLDSTKEEQLVESDTQADAEKANKSEAVEEIVTKVPQTPSEVVNYTLDMINELSNRGVIRPPTQPRNVCVYCHNNHHVSSCKDLKDKNEFEKKFTNVSCYICKESQHDLIDCKWLRVADLVHSFTSNEQQSLCEVCPYLTKTVQYPSMHLVCMFTWSYLEGIIKKMDSNLFRLPYCKVSQPPSPEVKIAQTRPVPASAMYRNNRTVSTKEVRKCYFCGDSSHFVRNCVLFKQKRNKRKQNKLKIVPPNYRNSPPTVVCTERTTNEQYIANRSITERKVVSVQMGKKPLKLSAESNNSFSKSEKPPIRSMVAQQERSSSCADQRPKTAVQNSITAALEISKQVTPETVKGPASVIQQKITEPSAELASLIHAKIQILLDKIELEKAQDEINWCVFCRDTNHTYPECKILKRTSAEDNEDKQGCIMCSSNHELLTCDWLKILHTVHSLTKESQEKVSDLCPVIKNVVDHPETPFYCKFSWCYIQREMKEYNRKKLDDSNLW
ncbi:hypothetical protein BsWGS_25859 [Bradybaena similaris]